MTSKEERIELSTITEKLMGVGGTTDKERNRLTFLASKMKSYECLLDTLCRYSEQFEDPELLAATLVNAGWRLCDYDGCDYAS